MRLMGMDIGGANTDYVIVDMTNDEIISIEVLRDYFPMWKNNNQLEEFLEKINEKYDADIICVSMTAELADCYESKKEGVEDISGKVMKIFENKEVYFVTFNGLKTFEELKQNYLSAAAANWIGTTEIIKLACPECIFMDMGSTTTDIIPIKNGKETAKGHTDHERLESGELIYTGMLRTNLAAITDKVKIGKKTYRTSSEFFSISADIHMILGNISMNDYACSTPDGNKKDVKSCKRRVSRLICADLDMLSDKEINEIALYVGEKQIEQITDGLREVVERTKINNIMISSLNKKLCVESARRLDLNIINLEEYVEKEIIKSITAVGTVQMYLNEHKPSISIIKKQI